EPVAGGPGVSHGLLGGEGLGGMMRKSFIVGVLSVAAWGMVAKGEENWAQFRGVGSQGHSDAKGLVVELGAADKVRWRTEIHGRAWSSPVVWGNQVWVTTATEDGKELFGVCVDRESGKIIHDLKLFEVATPQYAHPYNTYASPTPIVEQGRVYVTFGSPGTACLDTASGKVIWSRTDFVCNHFRGAASSPILFENLLIMHFDGSDYQYVVALDKATGKTVWKTNRSIDHKDLSPEGKPMLEGDLRKAFSTPVIATVEGKPVMVSLGSKACYGYDPRTGAELWRVEYRECHSGSPTPVLGEGMAYVCMGLSRGELWAIRLGGQGMITDTHVAWKVKRNVPTRNSPVLVGDLLYLVDDDGMAVCLESKTGQEVWRKRLKGVYSASPVYADGRIYFFSESGYITVIEPGRAYKQLSETRMPEGFMASAAVAGKAFYLRTKTSLYRVE
ncbi:MAG TPA: PQQ-binding-like beta-propeller repeat protein, partial [Tepidisphaeraceae bacterium]|nr:PQQ-binding-like beta-propeller repeat protein [Tepidisphaeraceae bacterium]